MEIINLICNIAIAISTTISALIILIASISALVYRHMLKRALESLGEAIPESLF